MKCLDLFSGTHSVANVLREKGLEVITLDVDGNSDININILEWDYKIYPSGYFDYIHASPECTKFSTMQYGLIGRKLKCTNYEPLTREMIEDQIQNIGLPPVYKTLEIINYFKPKYYTIENPAFGRLREYIDLPNTIVDYCKYGFPYQKSTRIWNNFNYQGMRCKKDCEFIVKVNDTDYHLQNCGNSKCNKKTRHLQNLEYGVKGGGNNKKERYRIPPKLIEDWLTYME